MGGGRGHSAGGSFSKSDWFGVSFWGGGNYLGDDLNKFMTVASAEKQ